MASTVACRWPAVSPARAAAFHVVFDESVGQLYSPFDTGFSGMSGLAEVLRNAGATVSLSSVPLSTLTRDFQGAGRVLVLGPAMSRRYSAADLAALRAFIASGGGVLVLLEHDDLFGNASMQAPLLQPLGIESLPEGAFGAGDERRAAFWPLARVERWGMDAELYYAAPLRVRAPATALAVLAHPETPDKAVVAASVESGAGRLAAVGDCELLWNMTPSTGVRRPGNRTFLLRLFRWLAHDAPAAPASRAPRLTHRGARRVLFDDSAGGLRPDDSPSGLGAFAAWLRARGLLPTVGGGTGTNYADFALVVLAAPLRPLADVAALSRAPRLLLAGDGQSDWLGDLPEIRAEIAKLVPEAPGQPPYPLDALTVPLGFRWRPRTLVAQGMDLAALGRWRSGETLPFARAGVLKPLAAEFAPGTQVLAEGVRGTWAARNIVPLVGPDDRPLERTPPAEATAGPLAALAVSTPRVFALADVDALTNLHFESELGRSTRAALAQWLGVAP